MSVACAIQFSNAVLMPLFLFCSLNEYILVFAYFSLYVHLYFPTL